MAVQLGSCTFAPRLFTSLVTAGLLVALIVLGRWQLHRADEKRALFDSFGAGSARLQLVDSNSPPLARYQRLATRGRYDARDQVLIDNMVSAEGEAGYFVITPFELSGGAWMLVNRGWVPVGTDRSVLPHVEVAADTRDIHGRADLLPRPGIRLGGVAPLAPPFPVRAIYPTFADIRALLPARHWSHAAEVVLLDASDAGGYERRWSPPGFPPARHIAYAVQWFGLALTLAVIYVVMNFKKRS